MTDREAELTAEVEALRERVAALEAQLRNAKNAAAQVGGQASWYQTR